MSVVAQAMVTMEQLVEYTLTAVKDQPYIPLVVAEFRHITVGGAISGASLESTSHRYGQLMDVVLWVKLRLGNGDIVTSNRNDDLWCHVSSTYGTMAIVLEAALECVKATPYVQVSYYAASTIEELTQRLIQESRPRSSSLWSDDNDQDDECFLEGLQWPKEYHPWTGTVAGVLMKGQMIGDSSTTTTTTNSSTYRLGWKVPNPGGPFYYEHVADLVTDHVQRRGPTVSLSSSSITEPFVQEVLEIRDYLFRYDPGAFWMARPLVFEWKHFGSYFPFTIGLFVASYRWVRKWFMTGYAFTTHNLFGWLKMAPPSIVASNMIVQDMYMPSAMAATELISWVRTHVPLSTPIWLCPVKSNDNQPFTPSYQKDNVVMINCGIYGRVGDGQGRWYTQQLEALCRRLGGRKMLYAQSHYDKSTFWKIYDAKLYDTKRRQFKADDAFPSLLDKTCGRPIPERDPNSWKEWIISLLL